MRYRNNRSNPRRAMAGERSGLRCAAVDRAVQVLETAEGPPGG